MRPKITGIDWFLNTRKWFRSDFSLTLNAIHANGYMDEIA